MSLTVVQKAGWGLADMGIVVFVIIKQLLVLAYLTSYLGVPIDIAGFVTSSVLIFDIFTVYSFMDNQLYTLPIYCRYCHKTIIIILDSDKWAAEAQDAAAVVLYFYTCHII